MVKGDKRLHNKERLTKQLKVATEIGISAEGTQNAAAVGKGKQGKVDVRKAQVLELIKNQMFPSEEHIEDVSDFASESDSITMSLGEKDTIGGSPSVRLNASDSEEISAVSSAAPEKVMSPAAWGNKDGAKNRPTFASLFAGNRQTSNGGKLQQMEVGEGPLQILETDIEDATDAWNYCLVGYFGGRFPGKIALQQIVASWEVKVSTHFHNSGWIIFKFDNEECQLQVIQGGPYMIYGRRLLLKIMSKFFKFENEELGKFPVWVQFRNLPLELWSNMALSRLCSKLGKPVCADKLTTEKARISYARALVEVDFSKEITKSIDLVLPNGEYMEQLVFYENLLQFCSNCKKVGHTLGGCEIVERISNRNKSTKDDSGRGSKAANTATENKSSNANACSSKSLDQPEAEEDKRQMAARNQHSLIAATSTAVQEIPEQCTHVAAGKITQADLKTAAEEDKLQVAARNQHLRIAATNTAVQEIPEQCTHVASGKIRQADTKTAAGNSKQTQKLSSTVQELTSADAAILVGQITTQHAEQCTHVAAGKIIQAEGSNANAETAARNSKQTQKLNSTVQELTSADAAAAKMKGTMEENQGDAAAGKMWQTPKHRNKQKSKKKERKGNTAELSS